MPPSDVPALAPPADPFSLWNAKLLETFFSCAAQGDEVWLQIDSDELDLIGPELGGDEGFLKAVRAGPAWPTLVKYGSFARGDTTDLVQRVLGLMRQRLYPADKPKGYVDPGLLSPSYRGCKAPTYLPFLAALVRSSALSSKEGYYAHLREALQLPEGWNSTQLGKLEKAWIDLEAWTAETKGKFGRFVPRRLGGYAHVGVPRAQCIMSRGDCEASGRVFAMAGLRPGQEWSAHLARDIISCARDILSATFRDALGYPELLDPIQDSLRSLFEDWDGSRPMSTGRGKDNEAHDATMSGQVELALSWQDSAQRWQVHWRVPPLREGSEVVLERGEARWRAPVWGTEYCGTLIDKDANAEASCNALEESATRDVHFEARLEEDGTEPSRLGRFELPRSELRVLVWGTDYASQREELQEHALPRYGCAYLLATQRVTSQLMGWLERGYVKHQPVDVAGLPPGWLLICLTDCSTLSEAQVDRLPGTVVANGINRVLAIVGGRSISRASKRQYLSYDLPAIELDAPPGTELHTDETLRLEETSLFSSGRTLGVRRFRVSLRHTTQKSFKIKAVLGSRELAGVTLRIAPDSGEQAATGKDFSLGPEGYPQALGSGLRGILTAVAPPQQPVLDELLSVTSNSLGTLVDAPTSGNLTSNPAALFLDSLALHGSMSYGTAKGQVARLLAASGNAVQPDKVLLDLRCRGHLEIETSTKGHFSRVHAVAPSLYQLPLTMGGSPVYAVLGSLRQQHWRSLFQQAGAGAIRCIAPAAGLLPTWRILADSEESAGRIAAASGLASLPTQSMQIASWAATCDDVRLQIEDGAVESIGALAHNPQRLHPGSGCFKDTSSLIPQSTCDLFRMDDRDIIGGRVYVLATRKGTMTRYGFVRDSRWGVWIALRAFASFVKEACSIEDACPWPIPYSTNDSTLFLPARISLPVVLERALVLCSGRAPEVVEADGLDIAGRLVVARRSDRKWLLATSQVYSDMASGRWLLYRSVPPQVASIVTGKVGATLASF